MDATDNYFERLTAAENEEHEQIEAELNNTVREGFTERSALAFVKTVVAVRKMVPSATIQGIFDAALVSGLDVVLSSLRAETQPAPMSAPKRRLKRSARLVM
jgi:hypothetical protein